VFPKGSLDLYTFNHSKMSYSITPYLKRWRPTCLLC